MGFQSFVLPVRDPSVEYSNGFRKLSESAPALDASAREIDRVGMDEKIMSTHEQPVTGQDGRVKRVYPRVSLVLIDIKGFQIA